jgi:hypothetical protein
MALIWHYTTRFKTLSRSSDSMKNKRYISKRWESLIRLESLSADSLMRCTTTWEYKNIGFMTKISHTKLTISKLITKETWLLKLKVHVALATSHMKQFITSMLTSRSINCFWTGRSYKETFQDSASMTRKDTSELHKSMMTRMIKHWWGKIYS